MDEKCLTDYLNKECEKMFPLTSGNHTLHFVSIRFIHKEGKRQVIGEYALEEEGKNEIIVSEVIMGTL